MTDNPTALPLSAEEFEKVVQQKLDEVQVGYSGPQAPLVFIVGYIASQSATITAKDAQIAAQAETIERLTKQGDETGRLLDDAILASKRWLTRAEKAEAEVAALRRENEQLRVDLKLADAAQHLPAALSPKEAPKP